MMDFLALLVEIFLWTVFGVWVVRRVFTWLAKRQPPAPVKILHRDPLCGTYVAEDISHPLEEDGKTLHFCSEECRMRYMARQKRSARA